MPLKPHDLVTALTPLLGFFDEIANLRAELREAVDKPPRSWPTLPPAPTLFPKYEDQLRERKDHAA